ncbi:MAG TPA: hypothetical protein VNW52_12400 [Burkholderiaceae bacterium]|jgi:hypothetical protein|nr:hypothetical protein [Burkholderiaceae bacterium]
MFKFSNPGKLFAIIGIVGALGGAALEAQAQATAVPVPPSTSPLDKFAAHKQRELTHIASRIQILQNLQACVQTANDRPSMKACHQAAHSAMKNLS